MDESSNLFCSGSDDTSVRVWDRRLLGDGDESRAKPVGKFLGHLEGITCVSSKVPFFLLDICAAAMSHILCDL